MVDSGSLHERASGPDHEPGTSGSEPVRETLDDLVARVMPDMADRFMWAVSTGPGHPDATAEKAVEQIIKPLVEALQTPATVERLGASHDE